MYLEMTESRLPNARMLNIWLNIEDNCSMKKIKKSENVMQQPKDSCDCGINTCSESILIRSYLLFCAINTFLLNSGTPILREM